MTPETRHPSDPSGHEPGQSSPWDWQQASDWSGRRALVLGAGESGQATASWLARRGLSVTLVDSRSEVVEHGPRHPQVDLRLNQPMPFDPSLLTGVDLLVPSPGLSPHPGKPRNIAALLGQARATGVAVASELDLFDWALSQLGQGQADGQGGTALRLFRPVVIGITGTNGKTTTASLVAHLLDQAGLRVCLAGNVSPALLAALGQAELSGVMPEAWVLELSSFQLAHSHRFTPNASVVLNLAEDHLDWHRDFEDYAQAKLAVHGLPKPSGFAAINLDEPDLLQRLARLKIPDGQQVRFGLGHPQQAQPSPADYGRVADGLTWLASLARPSKAQPEPRVQRLMPAEALRIRGRHNQSNALAALALVSAVGADLAMVLHGLRSYPGEPHRMQPILRLHEVEFIDDSKGTNVAATLAALQSEDAPVTVILGGDGKGQDFSALVGALQRREAQVVTIGRDGPEIHQRCRQAGIRSEQCASLEDAVRLAHSMAQEQASSLGHAQVLLSPACASLDMFRSYVHRAEVFAGVAQLLAEEAGQAC